MNSPRAAEPAILSSSTNIACISSCTHKNKKRCSQTHAHSTKTHAHITQTHAHITQTHAHLTQTHVHLTKIHAHLTQTHAHLTQTHVHLTTYIPGISAGRDAGNIGASACLCMSTDAPTLRLYRCTTIPFLQTHQHCISTHTPTLHLCRKYWCICMSMHVYRCTNVACLHQHCISAGAPTMLAMLAHLHLFLHTQTATKI